MATCASVIWSRPVVNTPKGKRLVPRWKLAAAGEATGPSVAFEETMSCWRVLPFAEGNSAAAGAGRLREPVPLSEPPQPATSARANRAATRARSLRGTGGIVDGVRIG